MRCDLPASLYLRPQKTLDVQEFFNTIGRVETLRAGEADVPQVAVLDLETTACPPATALNLGGLAFVSDYIVS